MTHTAFTMALWTTYRETIMSILGAYDSELQMFVEPEHGLDLNVLEFTRWLVEHGRLKGDISDDYRRQDCSAGDGATTSS